MRSVYSKLTQAKGNHLTQPKHAKLSHKIAWNVIGVVNSRTSPNVEVLLNEPDRPKGFVHQISGPAYIEPEWGYVITEDGHLVDQSLATTGVFGSKPWRYGIPGPQAHFRAVRSQSTPILKFPTVISLRFLWEWNYYHFYNDVLAKLSLMESAGVDLSVPIILGKYARDVPFVQNILKQGKFAEKNWIIADGAYVQADRIIYSGVEADDCRNKYDYINSQMQPPGPFPESKECIFLSRKTAQNRSITNSDAVETILKKYGFRSVDSGELSIEDQMDLFARTRYLVGIHGAGLTNIIFRQGAPFSMLELHAAGYRPPCFSDIAKAYNYAWDYLEGKSETDAGQHANFEINVEQLEEKIVKMLDGVTNDGA